jgi:hypothetical protein
MDELHAWIKKPLGFSGWKNSIWMKTLGKLHIKKLFFRLVCKWGKNPKKKFPFISECKMYSFICSFIHSFKKRGKSAVETGEGKKKTKELHFENLKAARYLQY